MFCPKCKCDYREGFKICADCNIPLVEKLPEEPKKEYIKFKELLQTYNSSDIAFIKSILDAHSIDYYVNGENFLALRPAVQPARIMVDEKQYNDAKQLLKDFKSRFTSFSISDDENSP